MNLHVIRAIFRRNFVSYFSNPTGYVFICVFVLLSSIAAFWPNEFFNSNLANLDQLNTYLPYILLVFIPAITMSIWADERRQGTDELLLTIPAGDFDVVLGKYLAAVAIFSVALLFSLVSNLSVLCWVGSPDVGLFLATYFGYWVVGWAMLAIGMVASFLTGNLTVGFVLGALFNVPLAFASSANVIADSDVAVAIQRWSIAHQFRDFSRGVISFSSVAYFLGIMALMLYLCMVLIGRRHWRGGQEGRGVALHYFVRFLALAAVVVSLDVFLARHDSLRADITVEGLSSLAPQTRKLLRDLNPKYPIQVYAYVSQNVPENYIQTKLNLLSTLSELKAAAGDKLDVDIRTLDPLSQDATQAEQQFGIRPQPVEGRSRGARAPEDIFLAVAVTCGLDKVVIPFFDRGLPVEYELVRSIATVSQQKRKKVGVLTTDAKLYGGFDMQSMSSTPNQMIIDELQKQYNVVQVDPNSPIKDQYDVLLAVQPSSLGPQPMEHFIAAVKNGQPTAIFEDPFPVFAGDVAGTTAEKQPPGGINAMMMGRQPPAPKGNIAPLWSILGVDFDGRDVIWQNYNPYPQIRGLPKEFVFIDEGVNEDAFNQQDPITSKIQELLLPYPGTFRGLNSSPLKFTVLVAASGNTGVVPANEIMERSFLGPRMNPNIGLFEKLTGDRYVMAARITGKLKPDHLMSDKKPADDESDDPKSDADKKPADDADTDPKADGDSPSSDAEPPADAGQEPSADGEDKPAARMSDTATESQADAGAADAVQKAGDEGPKHKPGEIDVVLVSDIDCLYSAFFQLRARGSEDEDEIEWRFENVTFILNLLDSLADDDRFIEIRKHRPVHRTLTKVAAETEPLLKQAESEQQKFSQDYDKAKDEAQAAFNEEIAKVQKQTDSDPRQQQQEIAMARKAGELRLNARFEELKQKRDKEFKSTRRQLAQTIRRVQDRYKLVGVLLPPMFPLLVGFFVYFNRRAREREGVAKARLRG
jgi:ABC-2 type transport system permease protein